MQTQEVNFTVTKQDFRAANYYIHFLYRRPQLFIAVGVLVIYLVYMLLVQLGVVKLWIWSIYITSGAVFWLLWQLTKLERTVRMYAKSSASILGKKSIFRYTESRMTMRVPEKAFHSSGMFADYPAAFETRGAILLYTSATELFLLPKRAFSPEKLNGLREILAKAMGDRFSSRYNKNAPHIPTAAELSAEAAKKEKEEQEAAQKEAEKAHKLAVKEAKKEGRDLLAEEEKAAEEAGAVIGPNFTPRKRSIADRANLVGNRGKSAEKKHS